MSYFKFLGGVFGDVHLRDAGQSFYLPARAKMQNGNVVGDHGATLLKQCGEQSGFARARFAADSNRAIGREGGVSVQDEQPALAQDRGEDKI